MTLQRDVDLILEQRWEAGTEIRLNNVPMEIEGGIGYQLTNVYPRPERMGEPGPADHPYNATHTQRTWVSGQLRRNLQEAADIGVYWDAHAWVQNRGKLGAPLLTRRIPIPAAAIPAGQATAGMVIPHKRLGDNFVFSVGNVEGHLYEYTAATQGFRPIGGSGEQRFDGTITNKGLVFRAPVAQDGARETWLYLPSTAGYTRVRDDATVVQAPLFEGDATVAMALHQNKLYRLLEGGVISFIINHDDNWEEVAALSDGSDPRNLFETYDDDGNRTIGVATSSGLHLLDHDNGLLWETDLKYPEHAYQGYGATRWRSDDWISVGVGIHRRVGALVTPEGLDNFEGLPDPLAGGHITDLAPSYNWLLAAISGELVGPDTSEEVRYEEAHGLTTSIPYPLVGLGSAADFLGTNRIGAIFGWNGLGWSRLSQWNRPPTRVEVGMIMNTNRAVREQHCFFGDYDGGAFLIRIPSNYYNPLISPTLPLERSWYLEESRLDWDSPDTPKLAKQFNCKVDQLFHTLPNGAGPYRNEIEVLCHWQDLEGRYHRSDDADILAGPGPYPFVGRVGTGGLVPIPHLTLRGEDDLDNSRRSASIGWERFTQDNTLLATGLPHQEIWFTYRGSNDVTAELESREPSPFTTGLLEWRSIVGRKWMRPNRVFTFVIDAEAAIKGESEENVLKFLDACCLKVGGVPLIVGDRFFIVDVTRLDGSNDAGLSPRGRRTITCLEFTDITYEDSIPPAA